MISALNSCISTPSQDSLNLLQIAIDTLVCNYSSSEDVPSQPLTTLALEIALLLKIPLKYHPNALHSFNMSILGFSEPTPTTPLEISLSSYLVDSLYTHYLTKSSPKIIQITLTFLSLNLIYQAMILERTDSEFIQSLKIIPDISLFNKKIVRANTSFLYTQSKFNLLREESEGFSKLLHVLSIKLDTDNLTRSEYSLKRPILINLKTKETMDKILSLIGAFELDSNRVLDQVLDVFISRVSDLYDFYLEFLKISPWATAYINNATNINTQMSSSSLNDEQTPEISQNNLDNSQKLPKRNLIAHMMGFKFDFYTSRLDLVPPIQLFWATALLIKNGLISLSDIYPHLYPSDDAFEDDYKEYLIYVAKLAKQSGKYQGPGLSGVLGDEGKPSSSSNTTSKPIEPPPIETVTFDRKNFKAQLAECLLAIGDLTNGRKIIARFPNLASMYPGISSALCRLLNVIIEPVYHPCRPFPLKDIDLSLFPLSNPTFNYKVNERASIGRKISVPKYAFFYKEWANGLPKVSNYATAIKVLRNLLVIVSAHLCNDIQLVYKIIRIGKANVTESQNDESVKNIWLNIISQHLFPAVSQIYSNPALTCEFGSFLKLWDYTTRYALYGEWKNITYKKIPELKVALTGCEKDTKYIMARLSKETIKQYGRYIGKTVHSNPTISFSYIVKQLESYDNMIVHVVDASRYLTDMELDILTYSLIEALSDRRKRRIEENGTSFALWLKSLATFCGTLFRRHDVDLKGILHYLYNQLAVDNIYDLLVLQEIISSMSGIRPVEDVTGDQIGALGAGETLRRESLMFESLKISSKSSKRLISAFLESNLAAPIGILMGCMKRDIIFLPDVSELKVLGWLHDHCKRSFLQYFDFVTCNLSLSEYAELFSSFATLFQENGIEMPLIFHILRPKLKYLIDKYDIENPKEVKLSVAVDKMEVDEPGEIEDDIKLVAEDQGIDEIHPALVETVEHVRILLPETHWKNINPCFFVTFWQLSLYDITAPEDIYKNEISKLKILIANLDSDKSDFSSVGIAKRKREKEAAMSSILLMDSELRTQEQNYIKVTQRLHNEKRLWFKNDAIQSNLALFLFQECINPRCLISPLDATFCARFVYLMHCIATPRFSTIGFLDKLFNREIAQIIIFSCTENEAKNYGYFLAAILQFLNKWHKDKNSYLSQASRPDLPGFVRKWDPESLSKLQWEESDMLSHDDFRSAMYKWQQKLRKSFMNSLKSNEYMQIRNSILILDRINEYYPVTTQTGELIEAVIKNLEETETRGDLKQLARAYFGKLKLRKSSWIPSSEYTIIKAKSSGHVTVSSDVTPGNVTPINHAPIQAIEEEIVTNSIIEITKEGEINKPIISIEPIVNHDLKTETVTTKITLDENIIPISEIVSGGISSEGNNVIVNDDILSAAVKIIVSDALSNTLQVSENDFVVVSKETEIEAKNENIIIESETLETIKEPQNENDKSGTISKSPSFVDIKELDQLRNAVLASTRKEKEAAQARASSDKKSPISQTPSKQSRNISSVVPRKPVQSMNNPNRRLSSRSDDRQYNSNKEFNRFDHRNDRSDNQHDFRGRNNKDPKTSQRMGEKDSWKPAQSDNPNRNEKEFPLPILRHNDNRLDAKDSGRNQRDTQQNFRPDSRRIDSKIDNTKSLRNDFRSSKPDKDGNDFRNESKDFRYNNNDFNFRNDSRTDTRSDKWPETRNDSRNDIKPNSWEASGEIISGSWNGYNDRPKFNPKKNIRQVSNADANDEKFSKSNIAATPKPKSDSEVVGKEMEKEPSTKPEEINQISPQKPKAEARFGDKNLRTRPGDSNERNFRDNARSRYNDNYKDRTGGNYDDRNRYETSNRRNNYEPYNRRESGGRDSTSSRPSIDMNEIRKEASSSSINFPKNDRKEGDYTQSTSIFNSKHENRNEYQNITNFDFKKDEKEEDGKIDKKDRKKGEKSRERGHRHRHGEHRSERSSASNSRRQSPHEGGKKRFFEDGEVMMSTSESGMSKSKSMTSISEPVLESKRFKINRQG